MRKISNLHQMLVAKLLGSGLLEKRWQKMKIKLSSDGGDVDWILGAPQPDIMADLCASRDDHLHSNSRLDC